MAETTTLRQDARPANIGELLAGVEPRTKVFSTTSKNRVVYLGIVEEGSKRVHQFVGRKIKDFLSLYSARDEDVVKYESPSNSEPIIAFLKYEGEIPSGERGRYTRLNKLLTKLGVPELK